MPWSKLAIRFINAYLNDDWIIAIVYGDPRIGKSSYACKVMFAVYDYLGWFNTSSDDTDFRVKNKIEVASRYMGWESTQVINKWDQIPKLIPDHVENWGRLPVFTWDDGGCWLFTLKWNDPLLVEVQRYFNVVGTDMNGMIITTPAPEWILSKIGNMAGAYWVKVIKTRGTGYKRIGRAPPSIQFSRRSTGYWPFQTPDLRKRRVRKRFTDDFSCKLEEGFYSWYKPIREHYAKMIKKEMKRVMMERVKEKEKERDDHGNI
jgi:hypothetical protein